MTLFTLCRSVAIESGFKEPASIIDNTLSISKQLLEFSNRECKSLASNDWQAIKKEGSITLASPTQEYSLPSDFNYIIPSSTWNRTDRRPVLNPLTSMEWQFYKGWTSIQGLNMRARIRNNKMEFENIIGAGDTGELIYFDYISDLWCLGSADTSATKKSFTVDTDTTVWDEELVRQGVLWRFKKLKGLLWQEDFAEYTGFKKKLMARDGGSRTLNLAGTEINSLAVNIPDKDF